MRIFYLVPLLFVILFSCRSKYDTSKAIDVLPTDEITLDYRLKDLPFKVDDESAVANVSEYAGNSIGKSGYFVKEVQYLSNRNGNTGSNDNSSGSLTFVTSKKLSILNISTNKTEHSAPHTISNPLLLTNKNFTLIFNENGYFSFFDKDLNDVWSGKIGLSDLEFLKEKSEKGLLETLNPRKKHTVTLSSRFVCSQDMCYALTTEGFLVTLDYTQKQVETKQIVQKQDIILDKIYQPLIVEGNIVFSAGNGEFAIYNIERKAVIGQSTFVDQESTSMFDVHLVKNIYSSGSNVIISHLNGMYAFNILQGQTLWEKNLTVEDILISENYMIFLDEKSQKITCMHIQSGEVKWAEPIKMKKKERAEVVLMNIMKDEKGEYSLAIGEKRGFHILSLEDGSQTSFKKANLENIAYSFVHNNKLYYIKSSNIYQVK